VSELQTPPITLHLASVAIVGIARFYRLPAFVARNICVDLCSSTPIKTASIGGITKLNRSTAIWATRYVEDIGKATAPQEQSSAAKVEDNTEEPATYLLPTAQ
jgi:hypothetical protein